MRSGSSGWLSGIVVTDDVVVIGELEETVVPPFAVRFGVRSRSLVRLFAFDGELAGCFFLIGAMGFLLSFEAYHRASRPGNRQTRRRPHLQAAYRVRSATPARTNAPCRSRHLLHAPQ